MSSSTKALDPAFQGVGQRPYPLMRGATLYNDVLVFKLWVLFSVLFNFI